MRRSFFLTVLFLVFYSVLAQADEDVVVARIGDRRITASDLNHMISLLDEKRQKILQDNPEMKKTFLQRWVKTSVISNIARQRGFDKRPEIREFIEFMNNDFLASEFINREIVREGEVTEEDAMVYYKMHPDEFKTPEMVKARHILVKVNRRATEEEKNKAKERAEEILKRIKAGEDFEKLAMEFSDDTVTKQKGGELGYVRRGMMVPSFEKALFSLKVGEVSDIVESPFGFHIIRVDENKESMIKPFEEVKDLARKKVIEKLKESKVAEFVQRALKDAGVEFYLDAIPGVKGSTHK